MIKEVGLGLSGIVTLPDFLIAIRNLTGLLDNLAAEVAPRSKVNWVISDLELNGTQVQVTGEGEAEDVHRVAHAYGTVGKALEVGKVIPFEAKRIREPAEGLVKLIGARIYAVRFDSPEFEAIISSPADKTAKTEEPIPPFAPAYGAIEGRVQTLTSRGSVHFTLYDLVHDRAVSCYLSPELDNVEEVMRDRWDRIVEVRGLVRHDPRTGRPVTIREITEVKLLGEYQPWRFREAKGVLHLASDTSPEQAVKEARDAW